MRTDGRTDRRQTERLTDRQTDKTDKTKKLDATDSLFAKLICFVLKT